MLATGLCHGLYPGLTAADSLRSLRSVPPRRSPSASAGCRATGPMRSSGRPPGARWSPSLAAIPLAVAGIRPLFVDSGGARLGGLGHPAFLAEVCLPAIYACLIQLYRHGRRARPVLLQSNVVILLLTGARAPLAYAVAVTGLSLCHPLRRVPARAAWCWSWPAGRRCRCWPLLPGELSDIRLFNVVAERDRQPQRARPAVAGIRGSRGAVAVVRLGHRCRQCGDPAGRPGRPAAAHLGGAQRVSAHRGRGRRVRPGAADRVASRPG